MSEAQIIQNIKYHNEMVAFHHKEATRLVEELKTGDGKTSPSRKGNKLSAEFTARLVRNTKRIKKN